METSDGRMRVYHFDEPIADSLGPRQARPSRWRSRRLWLPIVGVIGIVAALTAVVLYLGRPSDGRIPGGTRVAGVAIGGMTKPEARAAVRAHGETVVARGLVLVAGDNEFQIDTKRIGLYADAAGAVAAAQGDPGFVGRLRERLGLFGSKDIPLTFLFNRGSYAEATLPVRQAVRFDPKSATIALDSRGAFVVTAAEDGQRPAIQTLRDAVHDLGQVGPKIVVPTTVIPPIITTEEAEAAATKARLYVATPHMVTLKEVQREMPRDVTLRSAGFVQVGKAIRFSIARNVLRAHFSRVFGKRERPASNATFTINSKGQARIIGGKNGRGVDVGALAATWEADPGAVDVPITFGVREPALTNDEARNLGVKEVISEFFTPYGGGARVSNIKLGAKILDQYIIRPGKTFSLNKALGERTLARGFVAAPMIAENNVLEDSVGGGVSQISTTVFNAAFFAGLKLIAHTPHSFWITRYPMGREATVSWGGPEMIFQNNWEAPIVILTKTTDEGITVRFLSDPLGRKIEAIEGEPSSYTRAKTIRQRDLTLPPGATKVKQSLGSDGFLIEYGRKIYKNGKLISKEHWTWRYAPEDAIILVGPEIHPEPVPNPGATTDGAGSTGSGTGGSAGDPNTSTAPAGTT